jgi:hypothetical protein
VETFESGEFADCVFDVEKATGDYLNEAATCQKKATYFYSCECGEKGVQTFEVGEFAECTFDQEVQTEEYLDKPATCTRYQSYFYSCVCGKKNQATFTVPELGYADHVFDKEVATSTYLNEEATCQKKATYFYACVCGLKGEKTFESGGLGYCKYDQEVVDEKYLYSPATCKEVAYYFLSCKCGKSGFYVFSVEGFADHKFVKEILTTDYLEEEATCQKKATYFYACEECGEHSDETFEVGEVVPCEYEKEVFAPVGDKNGYIVYTCKWCEKGYTQELETGSEGLVYQSNRDGTCTVTSYGTCTDEAVVIPTYSPEGDLVTEIGKKAFHGYTKIVSLTLPEGLKTIGEDSFWACSNLAEVVIPDSVTTIGAWAFQETALTDVKIPDGVTTIGKGAFYRCKQLKKVELSENLTAISEKLFYECEKLEAIELGEKITAIGMHAFVRCIVLRSIVLNGTIERIDYQAFAGCKKLFEIIAKGDNSFAIGSTDGEGIAENALVVHDGESKIVEKDGFLFLTVNGTNYLIGNKGGVAKLVFPENYNGENYEISKYAFYDCDEIKSVELSNGITAIGEFAFCSCDFIAFFVVPDSVKIIGTGAISGLHLVSITLGKGLTSIPTFSGEKLVEIINHSSLTVQGQGGYSARQYFFKIHNGTSLIKNKNGYLFYEYFFDDVNFLMGYIGDDADLVLPETYSSNLGTGYVIHDKAFARMSQITSVVIPNGVKKICDRAFSQCINLKSVVIGDGVDQLQQAAFEACSSLETVTLGKSLSWIGDTIFYNCDALKTVKWQRVKMEMVFGDLFMMCNDLTIEFSGTTDEWTSMNKHPDWKYGDHPETLTVTIKCSNGTLYE